MLTVVVSAEKKFNSTFEPFYLYQKFVDIQFGIFNDAKAKSKPGNQAAKDKREKDEKYLNLVHNALAVHILFPRDRKKPELPDLLELVELKEEVEKRQEKGEESAGKKKKKSFELV